MDAQPTPPPEPSYRWGTENFCEPDVAKLYHAEPQRLNDPSLHFPVKLDTPPNPPTFCSVCLQWWADPNSEEGVVTPTPHQKGTP